MINAYCVSKEIREALEGVVNGKPSKTFWVSFYLRNDEQVGSGPSSLPFIVSEDEFNSFTVGKSYKLADL
jgi:hypothetical protein